MYPLVIILAIIINCGMLLNNNELPTYNYLKLFFVSFFFFIWWFEKSSLLIIGYAMLRTDLQFLCGSIKIFDAN